MSVINWPTSLGSPTIDGNVFTPPVMAIRQNVMRGAPRFRQTYISKPTDISLRFVFYGGQIETFEKFYWESLNAGTNQCRMNLYYFNGTQSLVLTFYPYTITYDSIINAANVSFRATFYPPIL